MAATLRRKRSTRDQKSLAHEVATSTIATSSLARHLHRGVGNAFVLYTNYKHYHWQTQGPHFRDLHLVFGEFALDVLGSIDHLASRIRIISQDPPTHLLDAMHLASVSAAAPHSTVRDMVEEADRNVFVMVSQLREAARVADACDDQGTVDVTSGLVHIYERHKWWLQDILVKREGPQLI